MRLEWMDLTADTGSAQPEAFADAVAVQLPAHPATSVPAVCMGQADQAVNIWQWRADSQADQLRQPPSEHGYVDWYPSTDDLSFPARVAGNPLALPAAGPVQNLVAGGFGTLTPLDEQVVEGMGVHHVSKWTVVFKRAFASPGEAQPGFTEGDVTDIAFAVWNGAQGDRDGQKSVSAFAQLQISEQAPPALRVTQPRTSQGPGLPLLALTLLSILGTADQHRRGSLEPPPCSP